MTTSRPIRAVAMAGASALLLALAACSEARVPESNSPPAPPPPRWGACPAEVAADAPQLQCGTVQVPLDYADPDGPQIEVEISRLASTKPEQRRGVLLLHPGGPGGSGLALANLLVSKGLPSSVLDSYDLIGMDTRGIGRSAPVSCRFTNDQEYYGNIPPYAPDDATVTTQATLAREVAERCAAGAGDGRLAQLSTANMARDLDQIRAALGERKASYLGYSYGSALGAAYAAMFPDSTDRIVLDSNIGDTHLDRDGLRRYAMGMELAFPDFAKWVAERHEVYGLGRTPEEVRQRYLTLAGQLDKAPVAGVDGAVFRLSTFVALYSPGSYDQAARAWMSLQGTGEAAPEPAPPAEPSAASPHDNTWSVFLAVTCNDVEWPHDDATYRRAVTEDRDRYPLYGAASANINPCAYWQHGPAEPPVRISADGPRNVLIVQNQRDPVTPLRGGELLREKFGERSRLVSVDAGGHGVYILGGNPCARDTVTGYLVDGKLPDDTTCPAA
ncbi:alpha/beta hydrolase [Nocardia sp. NPDC050712]|uniref:alpha/beta hydrolase n=1 Tax=Nocardia sp. NPDC050712 TaxID=3155518 RepID=UPI0033DEAA5D